MSNVYGNDDDDFIIVSTINRTLFLNARTLIYNSVLNI